MRRVQWHVCRGATNQHILATLIAILTHHFQLDHIGIPIALHVRGGAGVVSSLVTSDALERQISAADNHARSLVVLDDLMLQLAGLRDN